MKPTPERRTFADEMANLARILWPLTIACVVFYALVLTEGGENLHVSFRDSVTWIFGIGCGIYLAVKFRECGNVATEAKKGDDRARQPNSSDGIILEKVIRALQPGGFVAHDGQKLWDRDDVILDLKLGDKCLDVWYENRKGQKYHVMSWAGPVKLIQQTPIK